MHEPPGADARQFDRKVLMAFLIGAIFVALILAFAYRTKGQIQLTSAQARATQAFSEQLHRVTETIVTMETGQRGYLLTASESYREPYKAGRQALPEAVRRLQELMTDSPAQRASVVKLLALLDVRQNQMAHALDLHRTRGVEAAMEFVRTHQGHVTMLQIRQLLQRMSNEEQRILGLRRANETAMLRRNFWFSAALSALVVALMLVSYTLVRRESAVRAHTAEQLARTNTSLKERVRDSTRELRQANQTLQIEVEQRKRVEAELRSERQLLEQRVRERTAELVEVSAARARFLSAASHDLRQPLQTLTLLNATLREQRVNPLAARVIETQQQTLESMSRLVHTLLNINRLQSGAMQPEIRDVALGPLLSQLRTEFAPLARTRRIDLQIDECDLAVRSDATLLREIIQNLLSNAIRHTGCGEVQVRVRPEMSHVAVEVTDTGPGIPEDKREVIFEEFQQLESPAGTAPEGFGLGLSIVRHAARALGIAVELTSAVGAGTTFSLRVPLGERLAPEHEPAPVEANRPRLTVAGRILLIDDEAGVRNATALYLRISGHDVTTAASPQEVMQILETAPPLDLIISDYQLGAAQNGAELVALIRNRLGSLPAVILTGDTTRLSSQCTSLEHCRIFHKPVDAEQLAQHVQNLLARPQREAQFG